MKEINATCTKKQNLLRQQEWRLNVKPETETLFVVLYLNGEQRNLATSSSSWFHCCWWISTLIKYPSFLGVTSVRSVLELGVKNMEIKVAKIVVNVAEIKVY